jgi:PadR family transcriptional regulator AphA
MSEQLTTTSYAVLAQVAVHPWSTYELARQRVRYFRYVWPRAESAIYREAKRLASMGLIAGRTEYTGKRARTIYSITEAGKKELREWLATPVSPFAMDFEAMIRLFVAPLGTKEQIVTTLRQVRSDAEEMFRFAAGIKGEFLDGMSLTQDQLYIRALAIDFFVSLLHTVHAWATRTLAEMEDWEDLSPAGKNQRGIEIIRGLSVDTSDRALEGLSVPPQHQQRSKSSTRRQSAPRRNKRSE